MNVTRFGVESLTDPMSSPCHWQSRNPFISQKWISHFSLMFIIWFFFVLLYYGCSYSNNNDNSYNNCLNVVVVVVVVTVDSRRLVFLPFACAQMIWNNLFKLWQIFMDFLWFSFSFSFFHILYIVFCFGILSKYKSRIMQ